MNYRILLSPWCFVSTIFSVLITPSRSFAEIPPPTIDHGEVDATHHQEIEEFIEKSFMVDHRYSAEKISAFLTKLRHERESTRKDLYETKLFEKLTIDVKKYETAQRKAEEEASPQGSEILRGYDDYLIPHIEALLAAVQENKPAAYCHALVQGFIRGNITYAIPNAYRSHWPKDLEIPTFIHRLFSPLHFKKTTFATAEAFNLRVPVALIPKAQACLHHLLDPGAYLASSQLKKLADCGIDLSLLDPGFSPFWRELTPAERDHPLEIPEGIFPHAEEKISYQRVIWRSRNSPKIKANFVRNGEKIEFKIKFGQEVHSDFAAAALMRLVGLNQDVVSYRPRVRVWFDELSYAQFTAELANKYGRASVQRIIGAQGREGDEVWIEFDDALFEGRPRYELRVAPVDLWSGDLTNRREYRGILLFFAWVAMNDMQTVNTKQIFRPGPHGLEVLYRIHDPGFCLGGPLNLRNPNNIFGFFKNYRVNAFPTSFMKLRKDRNAVDIFWNDFPLRKRNYSSTTWSDLKWMARKIAQIPEPLLQAVLLNAGMPEPVAELYRYKLLARRNEIISNFDLQGEFPLADIPDFNTYTVKKDGITIIKKGKLVQKSFPGKNTVLAVGDNWWTTIPSLLNFGAPISEWQLGSSTHRFLLGVGGGLGVNNELRLEDYGSPTPTTTIPLGVGLQALLSRRVSTNHGTMNSEGKIRLYMVVDRIRLNVGIDSPLFRKLVDKLPLLSGGVRVNFFQKDFEFVHYADTVKDAYLSSFNLPRILRDIEHYVAYHLDPLEVVRIYTRYGVEVGAAVGLSAGKPVVATGIGVSAGVNKLLDRYYTRDPFGQVHYYRDAGKNVYGGINLNVGAIDLFPSSLALLKVTVAGDRFRNHQKDWVLKLGQLDRDQVEFWRHPHRQAEEYKALQILSAGKGHDELAEFAEVNYEVTAQGSSSVRNFSLFYLTNHLKAKQQASSQVRFPDGRVKNFYHYAQSSARFVGLDHFFGRISTFDLAVKNRRHTRIDVEFEGEEAEKFTVNIKTEDFFRTRSRAAVERLIQDLNYRYAPGKAEAFYRDFVLPPDQEVASYPNVYGLTHTLLYGKAVIEKLRALSGAELEQLAHEHFSGSWALAEGDRFAKGEGNSESMIKEKVTKLTKRIARVWQMLEDQGAKKDEVPAAEFTEGMAKQVAKIVAALETDVFGLHFFRRLLDNRSMYVMGEIAGILRSASNLQDLQPLQRRRFMAQSWGQYRNLPPLQKFLRRDRLIPPVLYLQRLYSDSRLFGHLEVGVPNNLETFYSREHEF